MMLNTQEIAGRWGNSVEITIDPSPLDWTRIDKSAACNVLEYIRWCAEMNPDTTLTVGQLWHMYQQGRDDGKYPTDITWELGLDDHPDW